MKKIVLTLITMLLIASTASAAEQYINGSTTAGFYNRRADSWREVELRVLAVSDRSLIDDVSYIVVSSEGEELKGFLLEHGLPGEPNKNTRLERERFVRMLEESIPAIESAKAEGLEREKKAGSFHSFEAWVFPLKKGLDVRLLVRLRDYEKKVDTYIYLKPEEIRGLAALLKEVPDVLEELRLKR